jgi:hypothetical protein
LEAGNAGKVFDAGVEVGEFGQIVEGFVFVAGDKRFELGFDGDDIDQVAMGSRGWRLRGSVRVDSGGNARNFRRPIAADQKVLGDEIALNS